MWMHPSKIAPHQANYLVALGRAIALAQNFEQNCKFVFGVNDFGEAFLAKKIGERDWQSYGKKLLKRSLGETLRARDQDQIFKSQIPVLEAARLARNYLAHEAAEPALYVPPMSGKQKVRDVILKKVDRRKIEQEREEMVVNYLQNVLPRFEKAIRDLAEGDNIVSEWSYLIQEKEVYLPVTTQSYVNDVFEWVLEPIGS